MDFVSHHVRTKLDELKRQEVSRLRMLLKAKMDAEQEPSKQGWGRWGRWGRGSLPPGPPGDYILGMWGLLGPHSTPTAKCTWTVD